MPKRKTKTPLSNTHKASSPTTSSLDVLNHAGIDGALEALRAARKLLPGRGVVLRLVPARPFAVFIGFGELGLDGLVLRCGCGLAYGLV